AALGARLMVVQAEVTATLRSGLAELDSKLRQWGWAQGYSTVGLARHPPCGRCEHGGCGMPSGAPWGGTWSTARCSAATLARRMRKERAQARDGDRAVAAAIAAVAELAPPQALAAALEERLVCLGKALLLHHRADVALGCHMHRLGDALRAVAKTLDVDMDFVLWGVEIKGDGDKARHEPLVAAGIKMEVCVAEPALELSGQVRWLGAQPYVPGWARAVVLLTESGFPNQEAETTAHADDRADGVVEDVPADDAKLHALEAHVSGDGAGGEQQEPEVFGFELVVLDARAMRHVLEAEAQLRSWEALYKVFETACSCGSAVCWTGSGASRTAGLLRVASRPRGNWPSPRRTPPSRARARASQPRKLPGRAAECGTATRWSLTDVPSHSLLATCDGAGDRPPFDVEGEEGVPPPLVEGKLFFT
ncbi:unnamed protein product, partial [Prorocentrum cordatum]